MRRAAVVLAALAAACGPDEATPDARGPALIDAEPPDADPDALPDLTLDRDRVAVDLALEVATFTESSCELDPDEQCVGGPGERTLLRFSVETMNVGRGDLALGSPLGNDDFAYSECHGHYHLTGYASYELLDGDGEVVATGRKQAFCLEDTRPYLDGAPPQRRFNCVTQGIQRGWSDVYASRLPCQAIDVTGLPDGDYVLRVTVDAAATIDEERDDNNAVEVAVSLGDPALRTPTEPCDVTAPLATANASRECGWDFAGAFACTPGDLLRLGCAEACSGLGSCTGDPMIRVCDPAAPAGCSNAAQLEPSPSQDDACGSLCPRAINVPCPAGGAVDVYTAPERLGEPYTCEIEVEALEPL